MTKLGKIAEKITQLKHGGNSNMPEAASLEFFGLVGEAFSEIDKSLNELKKNNTNVKCHCHHNSKIIEEAQQKTR